MAVLRYTDEACVIHCVDYPGLPVLLDRRCGVVWSVTDWLRHLRVVRGYSRATVRVWGEILREFVAYLEERQIDIAEVADAELGAWRGVCFRKSGSKARTNYKLQRIYTFYLWAQDHGHFPNEIVGVSDRVRRFPITVRRVKGRRREYFTSDLLFARVQGARGKAMPTSADVDAALAAVGGGEAVRLRNLLMWDWAELVGLRRSEILSLKTSDIPGREEIDRHREAQIAYSLRLEPEATKGGKGRIVPVDPNLLERTRDWIEIERADIVKLCKAQGLGRRRSDHIFLSRKTGEALTAKAASNLFRAASRAAGTRVWLHGGRHRFATLQTLERYKMALEIDGHHANQHAVLLVVKELLGHALLETTEGYIHLAEQELESLMHGGAAAFRATSERGAERDQATERNEKIRKVLLRYGLPAVDVQAILVALARAPDSA